jgi:GNAT superfamily N-acetyltransferase
MDEQPQDVARIVELGEAEAYADFYHSAPADFAARQGVRVERIGSAIAILMPGLDAMLFNRVMGLGVREPATATIGRAGWRHYLAFDGDQPVATGVLFVRHDIGWLGMAATLPSHRGRGAQGALMAQRIRDGMALGCRRLITETGQDTPGQPNPSYHNMLRTGFKLAYQRANYMPAGD